MCYTQKQSLLFFVVGMVVALYIYFKESSLAKTYIHYILFFYCGMELLQSIQYSYVDECDNPINIFLTEIAYVLVVVQPLLWNVFFYVNSNKFEKYIFKTAIYLCLFWIFMNVASRVLYKKVLVPQSSKRHAMAGDKVCTKKLQYAHLYWKWTSADFYDFNANYLSYLMLWFIPALISKSGFYYAMLFIMSIIITATFIYNIHSSREELFLTFTSSWCFISVPIVLVLILYIMFSKVKKNK